jgi:hypothetical protein
METDPPLNGEFMRESSPAFDWEVDSMDKLEAWDSGRSGAATASDRSAEADDAAQHEEWPDLPEPRPVDPRAGDEGEAEAPHHERGLSSIGLILNKLAGERD